MLVRMREEMGTCSLGGIWKAAIGRNTRGLLVIFAPELERDLGATKKLDATAPGKRPQVRQRNLRVVLRKEGRVRVKTSRRTHMCMERH